MITNINEDDLVRVDSTIPKDIRNYIKEKGYKLNELIRLGCMAKEDNPQLIDRIRKLESKFGIIETRLNLILDKVDTTLKLTKGKVSN